jgi:hypothetical protein
MVGDESATASALPAPPPAPADAVCCAQRDNETAGTCVLCHRAICKNCRGVVNSKHVCADCRTKVLNELEADKATVIKMPLALAGGVIAAVLSGAAWATMIVVTHMAIGYAALGVGFLTGWGVVLGAGNKRGRKLQWLAVGCSLLGLIMGKYFAVAHEIINHTEGAQDLSYFDPRLVRFFFDVFPQTLRPFDILWVILALRFAWRVPKPKTVSVS